MAKLISVNVGLPRNVAWDGKTVRTGIWKTAVDGPRLVRKLNIEGDGQGDLVGHGGEQRAVLVYQREAYDYWARELHRSDFVMGQFGENLTVDGLGDDEVCIGDRYQIGESLFEVSQPRVTCYRLGIRMNDPQMAALLVARGRPGFYFRVLKEGLIRAGDAIELVAPGRERLTVREIDGLLYLPGHPRDELERASHVPALSLGWKTSFAALLRQKDGAGGGNSGLVSDISPPSAWAGFHSARIAAIAHETSDVVALELEAMDQTNLPVPSPGQFVVLRLQPPLAAETAMRSYSICGVPSATRYRLGIKREAQGTVGTYVAERARAGDIVEMSAPRGSFILQPGDAPVVLLSAGIGVTPVLAMLRALVDQSSQRQVWWLYAARNSSEHPFAAEARHLLGALPCASSHVWYSRPADQDVLGRDYDGTGHIDPATFAGLGITPDAHFYLCGPPGLLETLRTELQQWGLAADHVHTELFGSRPASTPGVVAEATRAPHAPEGQPGSGPSVSFVRSNLQVRWSARFTSLLELAEACDVPVQWSCRTGVCHTCETGLISGELTYNPQPLEPPARGDALLCCSKPDNDTVFDL